MAWLLVEISDTIFPHLLLPSWAVTLVIVLLILGFPVALVLSWAYDITPEGLKRTEEVQAAESIPRLTGRKLDFIVIGMLALALGWFVWDKFGAGSDRPSAPVAAVASIAVLPFADMSPGKDQEYFSDGLSEEILNLLAQIRDLRVIGRTSSFAKLRDDPAFRAQLIRMTGLINAEREKLGMEPLP